jgi:hypothetical protein
MKSRPPTAVETVHPVVPRGVVGAPVNGLSDVFSYTLSLRVHRLLFLRDLEHFSLRLFAKKNYRAGLPYDVDVCKYDN